MEKHNTPLPWRISPVNKLWHETFRVIAPGNVQVAQVSTDGQRNDSQVTEANAMLIVRAVNSHDALVEALQLMIDSAAEMGIAIPDSVGIALENALAKAGV